MIEFSLVHLLKSALYLRTCRLNNYNYKKVNMICNYSAAENYRNITLRAVMIYSFWQKKPRYNKALNKVKL
jgi:hypothetical protein